MGMKLTMEIPLLIISAGCETHFIPNQTTRGLADYHEAAECTDVKNKVQFKNWL